MNYENIHKILDLSGSYQKWSVEAKKEKFKKLIPLLESFSEIYDEEYSKLPYRLNLLDELNTNENAHSKFLIQLLKYKPALVHFLQTINDSRETDFKFDTEIINKPILTAEKMRIDGLIRENSKYAIIIENKIHGAEDKYHQIARYVNKCRKEFNLKKERIYILYLIRKKGDEPSEQTWGSYNPKDFQFRYAKLSYKSEILPWLESFLQTLSSKEDLVKSAVIQYIDHLKHMFNKKEIFSKMNAELQKFLTDKLELISTDKAGNINFLNQKINEINELKEQLKELVTDTKKELFEEWGNKIKEQFDSNGKQFNKLDSSFLKTGITLEYRGQYFDVLIEHNFNTIYVGVRKLRDTDKLEIEIKKLLEPILESEDLKEDEHWYGWKYTSFANAYLRFEELANKVLERIKTAK